MVDGMDEAVWKLGSTPSNRLSFDATDLQSDVILGLLDYLTH
jgi:hypothetical protein